VVFCDRSLALHLAILGRATSAPSPFTTGGDLAAPGWHTRLRQAATPTSSTTSSRLCADAWLETLAPMTPYRRADRSSMTISASRAPSTSLEDSCMDAAIVTSRVGPGSRARARGALPERLGEGGAERKNYSLHLDTNFMLLQGQKARSSPQPGYRGQPFVGGSTASSGLYGAAQGTCLLFTRPGSPSTQSAITLGLARMKPLVRHQMPAALPGAAD
jgi:hypothetical protein